MLMKIQTFKEENIKIVYTVLDEKKCFKMHSVQLFCNNKFSNYLKIDEKIFFFEREKTFLQHPT